MTEDICALSCWERDDLHRGIRAGRLGDPFDEHEATYWKLGWLLYRDTHPQREQEDDTCQTVH
jgi:hypothetical protein